MKSDAATKRKKKVDAVPTAVTELEPLTEEDFYHLTNILATGATYMMIVGQRGNGKTYTCLTYALEQYKLHKHRFVYLRKLKEMVRTSKCKTLFDDIPVEKIFGKGYKVRYYSEMWQLVDPDGNIEDVIGYREAVNLVGTDKSSKFVDVKTIIFDEFIDMVGSRGMRGEIDMFENTINTIARVATDVKIFMLANTVSKFSPYFVHWDMNVRKIKQGEIRTSEFDNGHGFTKVALEYCVYNEKIAKRTSMYTKNKMITKGEWETQPVTEIPTVLGEINDDKLLFSAYDDEVDICIGCYLRTARWNTLETNEYKITYQKPHIRQFLILKYADSHSSYYHLTNQKSLCYTHWHTLPEMLNDIAENTQIDVRKELKMGRIYAEDDTVADYFFHIWEVFSNVNIRDLF